MKQHFVDSLRDVVPAVQAHVQLHGLLVVLLQFLSINVEVAGQDTQSYA